MAVRRVAEGMYEAAISERWWTPRGPLGGYVMALIMRGIELALDDAARPPRSLTVQFLRPPEAGPVVVRPVIERKGRSLTSATARLEQHDKLLALALAAFSAPWESPLLSDAEIPDVEPAGPRDAVKRGLDGTTVGPPAFIDQLTMQQRFGEPAFSGSRHAVTGGWLGLREERAIDSLAVLVLADAWYPAPWPRLKALAPAPTIEMNVLFRAALPLPDSLLLGRFTTRHVQDGFFEEDGELWAPDGTLVAQSRQLGLLIGAEA
jgi:acyl-CoA thioesterase